MDLLYFVFQDTRYIVGHILPVVNNFEYLQTKSTFSIEMI